jgi:hypothetical protein
LLTDGKYFRDTANVHEPLDVVVLEAHGIRTISTSRFTPAKARTGKAQMDDILDPAVCVVFIDASEERMLSLISEV